MDSDRPILLYDGHCALCNGIVRFVLRRDRARTVSFAPLQGEFAATVRARHPELRGFDTVAFMSVDRATGRERIHVRSDAAIAIGRYVGNAWRVAAGLSQLVPRRLRDFVYDLVARNRFRVSARYESCPLPPPEDRNRFLL